MPLFTRNINESLSFSDFINANSNLGFGNSSFFALFSNDSLGPNSSQSLVSSGSLGQLQNNLVGLNGPFDFGSPVFAPTQMFTPQGSAQQVGSRFFSPSGAESLGSFGLLQSRNLNETLSFADSVDIDGAFTRNLSESITTIARVGQAKGVFFRADPSSLVTSNPQVRLLSTTRDTGEIAVSERLSAGPLKILRYVPGSSVGSPNSTDLGSVPLTAQSQGFILDDSPTGVILRGAWEVKLIVHDTQALGQIKVHCNLFVVTASVSSVSHVLKIGPTKTTSTFTPSLTPTQFTLSWTAAEAGEIFIDTDQYLYVEVFIEEVTHPGSISYSRFRLDDYLNTSFSQFQFPGVTSDPTYSRSISEILGFSDSLAKTIGYVRNNSENHPQSSTLTRSAGLLRTVSQSMSISDFSAVARKNPLFESISAVDTLVRVVVNNKNLSEVLVITSNLSFSGDANKNISVNMPIEAHLSGNVTRPNTDKTQNQVNLRAVDPFILMKKRNLQ